jgi:hypothetical protein
VKFRRYGKTHTRRGGCAFFVWTCLYFFLFCLSSSLFLLLNSALVSSFYEKFARHGPSVLLRPSVVQVVLFIGPVLLIFFQWWFIDLVVDLLTPSQDRDEFVRDRKDTQGQ